MKVRQVVTGQDSEGLVTVVSDTAVASITLNHITGLQFHPMTAADEVVSLPGEGFLAQSLDDVPSINKVLMGGLFGSQRY